MKLWGGRFTKKTSELVEDFHSSISFDKRLYEEDIKGSIAHARMLGKKGIISENESDEIIKGLNEILKEIKEGKVEFSKEAEDIHMNIEKILTERIGDAAKKLHTARSRNDQVALDVRMYLKKECREITELLVDLQKVLLEKAKKNLDTIMPGYTHLQKAQPITLAHHLMAYVEMFYRDLTRLEDCCKRVDIMPLGSGALAGTTFPLDRQMVADELGFEAVTNNSLDAVSDRDFIIEFNSFAAAFMMHFSRFCEEIILWSTNEFDFIEIDDAYSTGSSIMPQKKNPDVAELIRGKTGRVYGNLVGILTIMKSLPLAYNKDMQEDKEMLFDTIDTLKGCLLNFIPMIETLKIKKEKMRNGANGGFTNATDVADYLAEKGVPFREAHRIVGELVLYCINDNKNLEDLTIEEFKNFSCEIEKDIYDAILVENCVKKRNIHGGPSPEMVKKSIDTAYSRLKK
jgi:argininosuccinate lyase